MFCFGDYPQVKAIRKEDEEALQRSGEGEESQEDKEENFLEAEQDHQEPEYP